MTGRFALAAALAVLGLALASPSLAAPKPAVAAPYPVTVTVDNGNVTIRKRPARIVSLSPTATETLFAIGAGKQVVAVDDQSDYPKQRTADDALRASRRTSRRSPRYKPDLVVIAFDPKGLSGALAGSASRRGPERGADAAGRVRADPPARQARAMRAEADALVGRMKAQVAHDRRSGAAKARRLTVYHELDDRPLLGDVEHVHRAGLRDVRPEEHRRRGRLRRARLPAALGRVHRRRRTPT